MGIFSHDEFDGGASPNKPSELETAISILSHYCLVKQLSWRLEYSEAEGLFYASAWGQGAEESWEVKKVSTAANAISYLAKAIAQ